MVVNCCDFITAHRNEDGTYRIVGLTTTKQDDGTEADTIVQIERARVHIEALDNKGEICKIILPNDSLETRGDT